MENNGSLRIGKSYKVAFQDAQNVLVKRGVVLEFDGIFITLKNVSGVVELIPLTRVLRLEAEK